jgi:hypothetical protein
MYKGKSNMRISTSSCFRMGNLIINIEILFEYCWTFLMRLNTSPIVVHTVPLNVFYPGDS